jgi:hypothetical protein
MIGRARMAAVPKENKKILITTLSTTESGEPVTQDATVQAALKDRPERATVKAIGSSVSLCTDRVIQE